MGRINAKTPPSDPADLTKWTMKVCQKSEYEAVKDIMSSQNRQRDIRLAAGIDFRLSEPSKKMAAVGQMYGQTPLEPCNNCLAGNAPFAECVIFEGQMVGKCAGCYYSQCDCNLAEGRSRPLRKRKEPGPLKRKLSVESSQASSSFLTMIETGAKRTNPGEVSISPAIPGSNTDVHICGALYLPNPKYCSLPQFWMELIFSLEPAFRQRNVRNTGSLQNRRPIQNLNQAFEAFKIKEQDSRKEQGYLHRPLPDETFVRPSGELTSPLVHLLHQPSTTTLNSEQEDAEVADYSNGCLRQIMGNAYTEGTLIFDWLHRRHRKSEGLKEYSEATLEIHEQFTMDILESLESKVILIYGKPVQERVISHSQLQIMCLPCWGPLEGITVQIFLEEGFRNAELEHRIRFYGLFLTHPQRQFYQAEDSPTAQLQDTMTKLAVQMTSNAVPLHEDYYAKRKWMNSNIRGKELHILNQHKKRIAEEAEQWSSLQERNELAVLALDELSSGDEDTLFFYNKPHDIQTLQRILPQAISAAQYPGKAWHEFADLPEAVISWLKGVKQSVFPDIEILALRDIENEYHNRYQAYETSASAVPPPVFCDDGIRQALLHIMYIQQDQVSKLEGPLIHLYYVRLDNYEVRLQCNNCDQMLDDDSHARWAVNRPDHYWTRRPYCHSQTCKGKRQTAVPVDDNLRKYYFHANKSAHQNLLYTQSKITTVHIDRDQMIRSSTEDELLTIESLCIRCGQNTLLKSGFHVYTDNDPKWTIGAKPKYVERRPTCMRCVKLGRASGRFIPKDPTIMSVDKDWLNSAAKICQTYRSEMRELLVQCFPPCRRDYRYGEQNSDIIPKK